MAFCDIEMLDRFSAALRQLQSRPLHGAGCGCCGGGMVRMGRQGIEADLLGGLALRYRASGETELRDIVEARLAGPQGSMRAWLEGDAPSAPSQPDRRRLLQDLMIMVERASEP